MLYPYPISAFTYPSNPEDMYWLFTQQYTPISLSGVPISASKQSCYPAGISKAELNLRNVMRALWEQHVAWTRMTIISIAANLPDEALVTKRLLRNATDMAAAFAPFYGNEIAVKFGNLMRDHLTIAAQLVKAAKAGDSQAAADAEKRWFANADEIATFLNYINPNWSKEDLTTMLYEHLRLTKSEAVYRLSGDYASDINVYDKIEQQALAMADAFADGIVKQFPYVFTK